MSAVSHLEKDAMKLTAASLILSLAFVAAQTRAPHAQTVQRINPEGHFTPRTYSHVAKVGNLLFIAGQVGFDKEGKLVGPTMREQYEQTLKNLQTVLASQGATFNGVAKLTIFVTSIDEFRAPELQEIRAKYLGDVKPASTLVQVVRLAEPGLKLEIEAIAALP
jgi:2-iminobutanoate/2-iminopropanoate deaminase